MRPVVRGPEINVTPLVDVVLVLLIIFMVVVPQLDAGASVTPPTAHHPDEGASMEEAFTVMVTADGALFLEKAPIERGALGAALVAQHKVDPHRPLRIKGDRGVPYRVIRGLYAQGQAAGFPGVGLEVGDPAKEGR
jgi:biopolymer transport protein TolR